MKAAYRINLPDMVLNKIGWGLVILAGAVGVITRFILNLSAYAQFEGDQIRDAFVYLDMRSGVWPLLGPGSSVGTFSLPPLYYYLVYPFTLISSDPIWQILPNAIFSFGSIILLMLILYLMANKLEPGKRIFAAGLGGLWWSLMYQDIYLNGHEWNPGPVICFFLGFCILFYFVMNREKIKWWKSLLYWIGMGIIVSFLASMHSMAWFIMPIVFLVCIIWYMTRRKNYLAPVGGIAASVAALTPYWIGESRTGFANLKALFQAMGGSANEGYSIVSRFNHSLEVFAELGPLVYFPEKSILMIFAVMATIAMVAFFFLYKGSRDLLIILLLTWSLFLLAIANFWEKIYYHYVVLIAIAPLLFFILALVQVNVRKKLFFVMAIAILFFIIVSMGINFDYDMNYAKNKFGPERQINTRDYNAIVKNIPENKTICSPDQWRLDRLRYFDETVFKKNLKYSQTCKPGMYYVHKKYYVEERFSDLFENNEYKYPGKIIKSENAYDIVSITK
ncbi:hypothetical protein KKC88_02865 [Patescibacteria group bacterium]|nr:hypothetical protein [Patescibacteria group bacterium]MBU1673813.1 hypothetical protein [Patescibacteria group bacterium]MBU1964060.1 hypothetical protein [Patescibacteria group bacterium]